MSENRIESAAGSDENSGSCFVDPLVGHFSVVRLDQSDECVGCGNEKRHRGKPASSLVCCRACWRKLPAWVKDAFMEDHRLPESGPEHGATIWQNRLSILLQWMRESDNMAKHKGYPHRAGNAAQPQIKTMGDYADEEIERWEYELPDHETPEPSSPPKARKPGVGCAALVGDCRRRMNEAKERWEKLANRRVYAKAAEERAFAEYDRLKRAYEAALTSTPTAKGEAQPPAQHL